MTLAYLILKYSVLPSSKDTPTKFNQGELCSKIIVVCSQMHIKHVKCGKAIMFFFNFQVNLLVNLMFL